MTIYSKLLMLGALASSTTGCATLLASKHDKVYITPSAGEDLSGVTVMDGNAPLVVTSADTYLLDFLPKGSVYVEVSSRDDHHLTVTNGSNVSQLSTGTELAAGWFVLDLFTTGPIGIVVDWVTHAWRRPDPLILHLPPSRAASSRPVVKKRGS